MERCTSILFIGGSPLGTEVAVRLTNKLVYRGDGEFKEVGVRGVGTVQATVGLTVRVAIAVNFHHLLQFNISLSFLLNF